MEPPAHNEFQLNPHDLTSRFATVWPVVSYLTIKQTSMEIGKSKVATLTSSFFIIKYL